MLVAPDLPSDKPEEDRDGDGLDRSEELFASDHGDHNEGVVDQVVFAIVEYGLLMGV